MKTKKVFTVCAALALSCQVALFAQEVKKGERKRPTIEQMQQMQSNQIVKSLALDDATAAKFAPVYKQYMEEMQACRKMGVSKKTEAKEENTKSPVAMRTTPRPMPTDAEVEASIKARFAQSRKMLDIREKYYNEFRKFLSPKQIEKIYNMERNNGNRFRNEMNRRQIMKEHSNMSQAKGKHHRQQATQK